MSTVTYTGILLALVATTAYNVGLIQEKRALGQMPALDIRRVLRVIGSLMTSRAWLTGFALMLIGLACQTIALTFEPVSVVPRLRLRSPPTANARPAMADGTMTAAIHPGLA